MTDTPENRNDGSEPANHSDAPREQQRDVSHESGSGPTDAQGAQGEPTSRSDVPEPPRAPSGPPTTPTPPNNTASYSTQTGATPVDGNQRFYGAPSAQTAPTTPSHYAPPVAGNVPPAFGHASNSSASGQQHGQFEGRTEKSGRRGTTVGLVAALAVGALVGGVSGAAVTGISMNSDQATETSSANSSPANITVNDAGDATTVTAVAASAGPSVVTISVADGSGSGGTGSGVILSKDGYVLTNTHVVTLDGASGNPTVSVQTSDGRLYQAEVVGTDPVSDLAVIKVDGATDFQPAEFADSSKLNVGDVAVAIGAPLGLANTVTNGIVSSLNRSITVASSAAPEEGGEPVPDDNGQQGPFDFWQFGQEDPDAAAPQANSTISLSVIQTDAAINPGNSGGALLNGDGEVIGINVAIASAGSGSGGASAQSGSIGVGFAIPANLAKRIAGEIIENGTGTHGLLGATVSNVDSSDSKVVGATIQEVSSGGAAESAGLKSGDVITKVDDIPITSQTDLTAQVRALPAGADTTLTYVRDGKSATTDVTLGSLG